MKTILALAILAVCLMASMSSAYPLNESQAASLANECFKVGVVVGSMNTAKIFAKESFTGQLSYNQMVDMVNLVIRLHNEALISLFSGNATALSELLVPTFDKI